MMDGPLQLNLFAVAVVVVAIFVSLLLFAIRWFKPPPRAPRSAEAPAKKTKGPPRQADPTATPDGPDGFDLESSLNKSSPPEASAPQRGAPEDTAPMTRAPAPAKPPVAEDAKASNVFTKKSLSGVIVPPRTSGARSHSPDDFDDVIPPVREPKPAPDLAPTPAPVSEAPAPPAPTPAAPPEPIPATPEPPVEAAPPLAPSMEEVASPPEAEAPAMAEFEIRDRDAPSVHLDPPPATPVEPEKVATQAPVPTPASPPEPAPPAEADEPVALEPIAPSPDPIPDPAPEPAPISAPDPEPVSSIPETLGEADEMELADILPPPEDLEPLEPLSEPQPEAAPEPPPVVAAPPPPPAAEPVPEAQAPEELSPPAPLPTEPPAPEAPPEPVPAPPALPPIVAGAPPPPTAPVVDNDKPAAPVVPDAPPQPPAPPAAPVVEAETPDDDDAFEAQLGRVRDIGAAASSATVSAPGFPVHAPEPEADEVDVKAFSPMTVAPREPFIVQAVFHPDGKDAEAAQVASLIDPSATQRASRSLSQIVQHGQTLTATLEVDGAEVDSPVQSVVWAGKTEGLQFLVELPDQFERMSALAKLRILIDGVSVGSAAWRIVVQAGAATSEDDAVAHVPTHYRKAFVSYSSKDREEVLKRVQGLQAAGIEVFQDVLDLEPGDRWAKELYKNIDDADAFYLFWSPDSAKSEWVAKEWRYALDRAMTHPEKRPDICPVILTAPPPTPPKELADRHFNDIIAYVLAAIEAQG